MTTLLVYHCKRCGHNFECTAILVNNKEWICPSCKHRHKKAVWTYEEVPVFMNKEKK